jgi:hypothetical protein
MPFKHSRTARICSRNLLALADVWLLWCAVQVIVNGRMFVRTYEAMNAVTDWWVSVAASPWLAAALAFVAIAAVAKERWLRNHVVGICVNAGFVIAASALDAAIATALMSPMFPLVRSLQGGGAPPIL